MVNPLVTGTTHIHSQCIVYQRNIDLSIHIRITQLMDQYVKLHCIDEQRQC